MPHDMMMNLLKERPVGSDNNTDILRYLETELTKMGYAITKLPFSCTVWQSGESVLMMNGREIEIHASPFSQPYNGAAKPVFVKSMAELEAADCRGCIVFIGGELAETPIMPKGYPFYYPDEHKRFIELLEAKQPAAVIAATGKYALSGLQPFPLFEDGNFPIPSAYMPEALFEELQNGDNAAEAQLFIQSENERRNSYQLAAHKTSENSCGKIVVCAHMDTKYITLGALDNAVGVAVLLKAAAMLKNSCYDIDIVPFNGEEYYEASGQVEYLKQVNAKQDKLSLVINIDSPCHIGSEIAVSLHNFSDSAKETVSRLMQSHNGVVRGIEWYAGDHMIFAFMGVPCMVLSSSDLFEGALDKTHTMQDTPDTVDLNQVEIAARYIADCIAEFDSAQ